MVLALFTVVICAIVSSYISNHQSVIEDATDKTDKLLTAYQETKLAVHSQRLDGLESPIVTPYVSRIVFSSLNGDVIRNWRDLTLGKQARASDWRHYGLALAMFGRPGSLDALLHATTLKNESASKHKPLSITSRQMLNQESSVSPEEERNAWTSLFGNAPIPASEARALKKTISQLKLGWFEKVALAKLYQHAGMNSQAALEVSAIRDSSARLVFSEELYVFLLLFGVVALLFSGFVQFVRYLDSPRSRTAYPPVTNKVRPYASAEVILPTVPPLPPDIIQEPANSDTLSSEAPVNSDYLAKLGDIESGFQYSYRSRTISFVVYLSVFLLVGALARLLRGPLSRLDVTLWLHISLSLSILLLIPVVTIALTVLRKLVAADSPGHLVPSWKQLLYSLGCRSRQPLADIGVGVASYIMMLPVMALGAFISVALFKFLHVKTPEHPLNYQMVVATDPLSQWLLFLAAAVAAPIVEELMFRGLLYPALRNRYGVAVGAAFSEAIFAIIHPNMPSGFLPLWIIGTWFAATFERRRSLLTTMTMHAIHNGLAVATMMAIMSR